MLETWGQKHTWMWHKKLWFSSCKLVICKFTADRVSLGHAEWRYMILPVKVMTQQPLPPGNFLPCNLPVHGCTMGESKSVSRSKGKLGKVSTQHWFCQSACCLTPSLLGLKIRLYPPPKRNLTWACIKQYRTVLTSIYLHVVRGFLKTVLKNIIK